MGNVEKLQIISFIKGVSFTAPIYSLYFLFHGVSLGEVTFTLVFYSLLNFLSEVPTGIFADKFGHKLSVVVGNLVNAVGVFSMVIFPNFIGLVLNNAIQGIGEAFLSGSQEALYYESYRKEKNSAEGYTKSFGKYSALSGYGFITSTLIAGVILQLFGQSSYVPLMIAHVLINVLTGLLALSLRNIDVKKVAEETGTHFFAFVGNSFKFIGKNRIILALTIVGILTLDGEYFLRETYQPFFEQIGVMPFFIAAVLGIGTIINSLIKQYSYLLEKSLNLDQILLLINILQGLFFIIFAFTTNPILAVVVFVSLQGIFNAQAPIVSDYVNQEIPSHMIATVLSSISVFRSFATVFLRMILSLLIGIIGLTNVYIVQGVYLIVGILVGSWILARCGCVKRIKTHITT